MRFRTSVEGIVGIGFLCVGLAVAAPTPPDDPGKTFGVLHQRGLDALASNDPAAALESLLDARSLVSKNQISATDTRNVDHAIAVAYLMQSRYDKAKPYVERSIGVRPASREEVYNLGVYDLKTKKDLVRSINAVKSYLALHKTTPDEPMLVLLGSCLDLAAETNRTGGNSNLFNDAVSLYTGTLKTLEQSRPGEHLWGDRWVSGAEWRQIEEDKRRTEGDIKFQQSQLDSAQREVADLKERIALQRRQDQMNGRMGRATGWEDNLARAQRRVDEYQDKIRDLRKQLPMPEFPKELAPVLPVTVMSIVRPVTPASETQPPASSTEAPPNKTKPPVQKPVDPEPPVAPPPEPVAAPERPAPERPAPDRPAPVAQAKKTVTRTVAAFAVGPDLLLTSASATQNATRIVVDSLDLPDATLEVVREDAATGLALVRVKGKPMAHATLATDFAGGEVTCVGFPNVSLFSAASSTIKGKADRAGASGWQISLAAHPRLAGAPVLDAAGSVVGMVVATRDDVPTRLPCTSATQIRAFLGADAPAKGNAASPLVVQLTFEQQHP